MKGDPKTNELRKKWIEMGYEFTDTKNSFRDGDYVYTQGAKGVYKV